MTDKKLKIKFHGKILDHLGIQMYQSPVAAIAELISNTWDADAEIVEIELPDSIEGDAVICIRDNGVGMTLLECEERYLNIGYCRRGDDNSAIKTEKQRPVLGRKGIGKFAGFGIAKQIELKTISKKTGELTRFILNLDELRQGDYVADGGEICVAEYHSPDEARKAQHGTEIILRNLVLKRNIRTDFAKSMARRFLLLKDAHDFSVKINGENLPRSGDLSGIEFSFPADYDPEQIPPGVILDDDGWAKETVAGHTIRWKINFYKETIDVEELRGVSVFANGKLAQKAFFFNLTGGLSGQHGQEYLSGQVIADYIDQMEFDIISPERQRINWEDENALPLEEWGKQRIKDLLSLWKTKRGEKRQEQIESKVEGFADRLEKFQPHERRIVRGTLKKLGSISTLSDEQFETLGTSVLHSWEQGRLQQLILDLSEIEELNETDLISILTEQDVLTALNVAEAVKTKKDTIEGLQKRVDRRELENPVRDYIAENPWLIDPKYQTFRKEKSLKKIFDEFAVKYQICEGHEEQRVDLILESGTQLTVLEFMRPGKPLDQDHLSRYEYYFREIDAHLKANTGLPYRSVEGIVIADNLNRNPVFNGKLASLAKEEMYAYDWKTLLARAGSQWGEFFDALMDRTPKDARMDKLSEIS